MLSMQGYGSRHKAYIVAVKIMTVKLATDLGMVKLAVKLIGRLNSTKLLLILSYIELIRVNCRKLGID